MKSQEERVTWENGNLVAEGLLFRASEDIGVVVCHPHPQMGGAMYDIVVDTTCDVFACQGFSTLRFNFRGVGGSTGDYDNGNGEKQDLLSACAFMKKKGIRNVIFSGYSFGAWVGCNVIRENPSIFTGAYLISPPDKFSKFEWDGMENLVDLIVCGKLDPFCDIKNLQIISERIGAKFVLLESVDHFYAGHEAKLADCLKKHISQKK